MKEITQLMSADEWVTWLGWKPPAMPLVCCCAVSCHTCLRALSYWQPEQSAVCLLLPFGTRVHLLSPQGPGSIPAI